MQPTRNANNEPSDASDRPTIPVPASFPRPVSMQAPAGTHAARFGAGREVAVDSLSDMVWGCSTDGVFDYLGPQWFAFTGIPAEEQLGRSWTELLHPGDAQRVKQAFRGAAHAETALEVDLRVRRHDGAFRWFRVRGRLNASGHAGQRFCGTCTDVEDLFQAKQDIRVLTQALSARIVERTEQLMRETTRRQQASEQALRDKNQELARSNQELEQFAYVASHDLQEPLRAIAGCAQLLRQRYQGKLDADADEIVSNVVEGAERMTALIQAILMLSRVSSHGATFVRVESGSLLQDALRNLSVAIEDSAATISHAELPAVYADPTQLTQLFQNLLSNAIKYRSARRPELHVSAEPVDDGWCFSIRDNGIGIERQYYERIFGIFQRLHTRSKYPGTGIGLAICKKIVERHNGRIWVQATPELGSTFCFTLRTEALSKSGADGPIDGNPAG